jgi:trehalose-phosphatase
MRQLSPSVVRKIFADIERRGCVLMTDFDGTISKIVDVPAHAHISPEARRALAQCAKAFPVAIITGRRLSDVRRRAGIPGISYIGNHGLEWAVGNDRGRVHLSPSVRQALRDLARALRTPESKYPGLLIGNKELTISAHTRNMTAAKRKQFRNEFIRIFMPFKKRGLTYREGREYVYNIRPIIGPDKGDAVRRIRAHAPSRAVPIFLGDDATDEDAFEVLKRGVTIRVGKWKGSTAKYFVRSRDEIDAFLLKLAAHAEVRKR